MSVRPLIARALQVAERIDLKDIVAIPVSGLKGDNITSPSDHTLSGPGL